MLVACSQPTAEPDQTLLDKKWVALRVGDESTFPGDIRDADGFRNLSLSFALDGKLNGYDGCNAFGGDYTASLTALNIGVGESTTRGCEAGILEQGERYTSALTEAVAYRIVEDDLEFQNSAGETILWFTKADASYELTLDLRSDMPVTLGEQSKIRIVVSGDDEFIADEAPTTLVDEVIPLPTLDAKLSVAFEEESLLALDYLSGPGALLGYSMSFVIDADGDGQVCVGDYRQDFDRTEIRFYEQADTGEQVQEIYLLQITDPNECRPFSADL